MYESLSRLGGGGIHLILKVMIIIPVETDTSDAHYIQLLNTKIEKLCINKTNNVRIKNIITDNTSDSN
jgi:hypothetical protein